MQPSTITDSTIHCSGGNSWHRAGGDPSRPRLCWSDIGIGEGQLHDGCSRFRSCRAWWRNAGGRAGLDGAFRQPLPFAGAAAPVLAFAGAMGRRICRARLGLDGRLDRLGHHAIADGLSRRPVRAAPVVDHRAVHRRLGNRLYRPCRFLPLAARGNRRSRHRQRDLPPGGLRDLIGKGGVLAYRPRLLDPHLRRDVWRRDRAGCDAGARHHYGCSHRAGRRRPPRAAGGAADRVGPRLGRRTGQGAGGWASPGVRKARRDARCLPPPSSR